MVKVVQGWQAADWPGKVSDLQWAPQWGSGLGNKKPDRQRPGTLWVWGWSTKKNLIWIQNFIIVLLKVTYAWGSGCVNMPVGRNSVQNNSQSLYFGLIIPPNCLRPTVEVRWYQFATTLKTFIACFFQLSNRLGTAKCAADLVTPSAVARTGEQAIAIEGRNTDFFLTRDSNICDDTFGAGLKMHNQLINFIL